MKEINRKRRHQADHNLILFDKMRVPLKPLPLHCVKSDFYGPCFPVFGMNTDIYGPEKTPYLDTFHAVLI